MTGRFRTLTGGRIDRSKPLAFRFDDQQLTGFQGDTLASALLANGVHLVGRSFKYHRPRGILAAGSEEPNALVTVARDAARRTPNLRATQVELYQGLTASSQNRWPSLAFDALAINDRLAPLYVAGFYYKTFMWPRSFWKTVYEPLIRAAAGLGRAPTEADPDRYQNRFAHCDVLVVGSGPAGLAAALAAVESGARVILCDEQAELGGSLLAEHVAQIEGAPAHAWMAELVMGMALKDKVRLLPRTTAFGYFSDNLVALAERITDHQAGPDPRLPRERLWQVRAKEVVLATGAIERPLVFPDNDRPGIMLADAAQTYVERYGVKPGSRAVIVTTDSSAYAAARSLARAGVEVAAIVDLRPEPGIASEFRVLPATTICGTKGRLRIHSVELGRIGADGRVSPGEVVPCDLLLISGGWTPALHLFSQSRGKLRFDAARSMYLPDRSLERVRSAGACNGTFDLEAGIAEGYAAGEAAASAATGRPHRSVKRFTVTDAPAMGGITVAALPHARQPARVRAFVDFQNDVTAKDLKLATTEGFRSIEHVKRFTTTGMATDQGKTSNMNALGIVAEATGRPIPAVGLTTFRQPYTPTTFGTFAGTSRGELFDPVRKTPMHDWAVARGAAFEDVGSWKRAWYYPGGAEDLHEAVARECRTVRQKVGLFDASTLGKIEVVGPDAAEFLHRIYVNPFLKLEPGRCRYGILCRDDGFAYDDGVIARLAVDRFHVTTTTGGAPRVLALMEDYLQTEWTDLRVWLTSTTEQWAVVAIQGLLARDVLRPLVAGIDLANEALPHMSVSQGEIAGVPARLFRVSFSGELGYEVNVPASAGPAVWEAVWSGVEQAGGCAYGTEAMHVLRAEKGYIIVGQDTDGTVTPDEAGLGWAVGHSKPDFVGKRGMLRADLQHPDRKQFVGLLTADGRTLLEEGAQITAMADPPLGTHALGHVTSAYASPTLGHPIALALVERGRSRMSETLFVPMPEGSIPVRVVDPVFYDREGKRLHG